MIIDSKQYRVPPDKKIDLGKWPTVVHPYAKSKKLYKELLQEHMEKLSSLQQLHYASHKYALLLIFQGMDAAGKDGAIRHVMSGVNPEGCEVFSFKPAGIIKQLDLLRPIYRSTTNYGHFGKADLPWEQTNRTKELLAAAK